MDNASAVSKELKLLSRPEKLAVLQSFFCTGKGEYADGDLFLGIAVPEQRKIALKYRHLPITEVIKLLHGSLHEERLVALLILVDQFTRGDEEKKQSVYHHYLNSTQWINNWDLVDTSADKIVGKFLLQRSKEKLYELAKSNLLWERRIAIVATYAFIRQHQFDDTIAISEVLLHDKHDLIHKACGWMLREMGKRDQAPLRAFLANYAASMPRTMLRYAIEKFSADERQGYLQKKAKSKV